MVGSKTWNSEYKILMTDGNALSQGKCSAANYVDYTINADGTLSCLHPNSTLYSVLANDSANGLVWASLGVNGAGAIGSDNSGSVKGVVGAVKTLNLMTGVTRLYVGLFNRAPDIGGLRYWVGQMRDYNVPLSTIARAMYNAPESQAIYNSNPNFTNSDRITIFYKNVLGRSPDQDGLNYWTSQVTSTHTIDQVFCDIINAVVEYIYQNGSTDPLALQAYTSQKLLNNKVAVGLYYATILGKDVVNGNVQPFKDVLSTVTDNIVNVYNANNTAAGGLPK